MALLTAWSRVWLHLLSMMATLGLAEQGSGEPSKHMYRTALTMWQCCAGWLCKGAWRRACCRAPAGACGQVVQLVGVAHHPKGAADGAVGREGPLRHVGLGQHHRACLAQQLDLHPASHKV